MPPTKGSAQQRCRWCGRSDSRRTWRLYQRALEKYQGANQAEAIQATTGQEGRDTQTKRRSEETRYTDRNGRGNSARYRAGDKPDV